MITIMSNWREIFEDGAEISLPLSAILFRREDRVRRIFLIVAGSVKLERGLADGAPLVLKQAAAGALLAEASLFAERYHCDAIASEASLLLALPKKTVLDRLNAVPTSAIAMYAETCKEVQQLRARIEILRLKRVSDRLDAWLELFDAPRKGQWVDVAEAIGVTPPALYRELARRRTIT